VRFSDAPKVACRTVSNVPRIEIRGSFTNYAGRPIGSKAIDNQRVPQGLVGIITGQANDDRYWIESPSTHHSAPFD